MPRIDALFQFLAKDVSPESAEVLAEGIALADPDNACRIAEILIERRHEAAWASLAGAYSSLSAALRERMVRRRELLLPGLASALRDPSVDRRRNALELLVDLPQPELAYRAAESVLDATPAVREAAVRALVRIAEDALERGPDARRQVATALRDMLRTFERHRSPELLRLALWYAPELEDELWRVISSVGGTGPQMVERHLGEWSEPRLAPFLLLALGQPRWLHAARAALDQWQSRECGLAIVRRLDLLARPEVRQALHHLRNPLWFVAVVGSLKDLSPTIIASLPVWVRHLGFQDHEKLNCLDAWTRSRRPELQLGAVHAIAAMNDSRAFKALEAIAPREGAAGTFARWVLVGHHLWEQRAAAHRRHSGAVRSG